MTLDEFFSLKSGDRIIRSCDGNTFLVVNSDVNKCVTVVSCKRITHDDLNVWYTKNKKQEPEKISTVFGALQTGRQVMHNNLVNPFVITSIDKEDSTLIAVQSTTVKEDSLKMYDIGTKK